MKDINDDYTMLLKNHYKKDLEVTSYPWVTFTDDRLLLEDTLNRPLEFAIDEGRWPPHRHKDHLDDDFLFDVNFGLIIATRHKPFFRGRGQVTITT